MKEKNPAILQTVTNVSTKVANALVLVPTGLDTGYKRKNRGINVTKIHMMKRALLSATAVFAATSAHAQVADSWAVSGDILVTSTNTADTTDLNPADAGVDTASIADGFKNSISGSAVGSSASSSFTSVNNSGVGGAAELAIDGTVTVAAGNSSAVTNNTDILTSATITAGSGNSISLAAVGSSASVSASTTLSDAANGASGAAVAGGETFLYSAGALTISSGAADGSVDPVSGSTDGGNSGAVTLNLATGLNTGTIADGQNNTISVAGVGSSASASFSATVGGTTDASTLDSASFTLADGATISAANDTDAAVQVNLGGGILLPTITAGNGNGISAAAVGSSASFSLASTAFAAGVITDFSADIGALQIDSTNGADVAIGAADGADATTITDATISAGSGNSISSSAVGSSGSVSYANTVYVGGAGAAGGSVNFAEIAVNSTNNGSVTNNTSLVQDANDNGGLITGDNRNSISIAGIGSSASQSLSVTDYSGAGLTGVASTVDGGITLASLNTGVVTVVGALQGASIATGFSNSISAAAVGASASQSVTRTLVGVAP